MKDKFLDECKIIEQNCTYTAEAHHRIAASAKRKTIWLEVVPAIVAAGTSALVSAGFAGNSLLPFTVLSAAVSAVTAVLNPNKENQDHLSAAKNFTTIKHDARFLWTAQAATMSEETFALAVETLHQRYNELVKSSPPTKDEEFSEARKVVHSGIHAPDRGAGGELS